MRLITRNDASLTAALVHAAAAVMVDAAEARAQTNTLKKLLVFSQALGHALDRESLQQALSQQLPTLLAGRPFSVLLREDDVWNVLVKDGPSGFRPAQDVEQIAKRAVAGAASGDAERTAPFSAGVDICFPIVVGAHVAGVLSVGVAPPLTRDAQEAVSSAAAMIGIACKNMWLLAEAREQSMRDALTGCFTKAHGEQTLTLELARARRTGDPLSVLMFDVDNFKGINDHHGHLSGDEVLRAVGIEVGRVLRKTDVRCRYGGDEFLIILPDTPSLGAQQVAEALRQAIANIRIQADQSIVTASISIGVAASVAGEMNPKTLLARADDALYQAKRNGRNRVALAIPPSAADPGLGVSAIAV